MGRPRIELTYVCPVSREERIEKLLHAVKLIPRGTRLEELKAAYLESVINKNNGNRTNAALEIDVPLRTLRYWIYETYKLDLIPPMYNSKPPKPNHKRPTKDKLPKRKPRKRNRNYENN